QNDVTLKMPAFEWVHVQLHQQKGMISLSPPTICNSAVLPAPRFIKFLKTKGPRDTPIFIVKWFTEFGHLNRGDMLTSEQHRCHNEKKKFQRRV
ncbi:hypothetical protein QS388_24940, partial [Escherichia coli]|nr:hypothetical protein [Escherichia coli]